MAASASNPDELLREPLYVFDLPPQLLETLTLKSVSPNAEQAQEDASLSANAASNGKATETAATDSDHEVASTTGCSLCQVKTATVQEQREHIRSDHHRYNTKARLRGTPALSEPEFAKAIGDLDESISGSESESSSEEEDDGGNTMLANLLKKQAKISSLDGEDEDTDSALTVSLNRHPLVWFGSSMFPTSISLGIYRAIFPRVELGQNDEMLRSLKSKQHPAIPNKQIPANPTPKSEAGTPHYFLCMIGGGHFAAMIVSLAPVLHVQAGGIQDRQPRVLAHKTFHRYTTRRKQGGSQSAMDSGKGAASTAGSSLRRYNEAALQTDVRELLNEWKDWINSADLIFVRATGNTNRRVLFGPYDGQVMHHNDPRVRTFPFSTKRATQSELMNAFMELTRVKVSHVDEAALAAAAEKQKKEAAEAEAERLRKSTQQKKEKATKKVSAEEEGHIMHTTQLQALIRRSKIPALLSYISNNGVPADFTFHPSPSTAQKQQAQQAQSHSHAPTPLHLAASSGAPLIVDALLTKAKLDPTLQNAEGKTAFEVSSDRATRDAFRVARHELGESAFDWSAARVPGPLARKDVESKHAADKAAAEEAEAKRRKAEVERLRKEDEQRKTDERERKFGGGKTIAPLEKSWSEKREEEMRGMTPEMKMRIERERRARAAEERIKRMQQAGRGGGA